jgi:uncharacterized protein with PQ loop repeat
MNRGDWRRRRDTDDALLAAASAQGVAQKNTRSISLPTFTVLSIGVACWVVYGWGTGDLVVIGANSVSLCLIVTVLIAKLRYG